ncbi:hypothetical protein J6590_021644 [Homalodisca vitripennis]|nr:hypothetical protein J6590_021644 [Homalodisca vitripennis]
MLVLRPWKSKKVRPGVFFCHPPTDLNDYRESGRKGVQSEEHKDEDEDKSEETG